MGGNGKGGNGKAGEVATIAMPPNVIPAKYERLELRLGSPDFSGNDHLQ